MERDREVVAPRLVVAEGGAANWLTHLQREWANPVWRHWMRFLAGHFRFVRSDERGCGMSDLDASLSVEHWLTDLEDLVEQAAIDQPFVLLGLSQGAAPAVAYAAQHPERVERLILYGGYALGWDLRGDEEGAREYRSICDLVDSRWASDNPTFRQLFTSRFIPEGTAEQLEWFNDLCRLTVPARNAGPLLRLRAEVDVREWLPRVQAPTLVLHARGDEVVPIASGRYLASAIPDAEFVELDSPNHILLEHEEAWGEFQRHVLRFTGIAAIAATAATAPGPTAAVFDTLSPRQWEVLTLLSEGLSNIEIAERLSISEKTVRNHTTQLFDKLGVWSRAQAIVFARDHGFPGGGGAGNSQ